jgi:hypothetical protein
MAGNDKGDEIPESVPISSAAGAAESPLAADRPGSAEEQKSALATTHASPFARLGDLSAIESELAAIQIPREILEVAEEIADASDVPGIETGPLEHLVRFLLWAGRTMYQLEEKQRKAGA